ncbi:MAG: NUDIX domain-containing protein [bacterium]|nr:NUDIX domain-containing protein [bacterium]
MTTRRQVYEQYPSVVVAVIIEKDGKVMLVQEAGIDRGQWNHPAGWLDKGENPVVAAKREAEEETGLQVEIAYFLGVYNFIKDKALTEDHIERHAVKLVFVGKVIGGTIKLDPEEIMDARWFTPEEMYDMKEMVLRDMDIKNEVRDYFAGKRYPLEIVHHFSGN